MNRVSNFSDRLKEYRKIHDLTLLDMERITHLPAQTLNRYELAQRTPKVDVANNIAEAIGVNALWLQGFDVPMFSPIETTHAHDDSVAASIALSEAQELFEKYKSLDSRGKETVRNVLALEHLRMSEKYSIGMDIGDIIEAAAYGGESVTKTLTKEQRKKSDEAYRRMMNPHTERE